MEMLIACILLRLEAMKSSASLWSS